jgi:hypothetical protein
MKTGDRRLETEYRRQNGEDESSSYFWLQSPDFCILFKERFL